MYRLVSFSTLPGIKIIDHQIISMAILLPSADSWRVVVSYKWKYEHKVLVNRLVKQTQEKMCLDELTIATWP